MPAEIGILDRAILTAQNKLSQLLSLAAPGEGDNVAIRIARNAVEKAKLAKQAAVGSQQGMAKFFGQSAAGAVGGSPTLLPGVGADINFINQMMGLPHQETPVETALSLLSQNLPNVPSTIANFPSLGELAGFYGFGAAPSGGQMMQPGLSPLPAKGLTPGGRAPMPTAAQPVRFLPGQQQGSQFPGSPMGQRLPGGGQRPQPVPRIPKPRQAPRRAPGRRV